MEKKTYSNKPNNVLFGVGEHTTVLQNKVICASLSCFNTGTYKVEEIQKFTPQEREEFIHTITMKEHELPIEIFASKSTRGSFKERLRKQVEKASFSQFQVDNENGFGYYSIFDRCLYKEDRAIISLRFSNSFAEILTSMFQNGYTPIALESYIKLSKEYAGKLYLIIISYLSFGKKSITTEFVLDELKLNLGIKDHDNNYVKKAYEEWGALQRFVLDPAIQDINTNSDIEITYTTKRKGRKIHWITLEIKRKPKTKPLTQQEESKQLSLFLALGINPTKAKELTVKYPLEFAEFATSRAKQRAKDNPAGYLLTALEDMYELWESKQAQEQAEKENEAFRKAQADKIAQEKKTKESEEDIKKAAEQAKFQALQAEFDALPQEEQERLQKEKSLKMETMFLPDALYYKMMRDSGEM